MSSANQCATCGASAPAIRRPANLRQALWGGWTCPNCGTELNRWGHSMGPATPRRTTWTRDESSPASHPAGLSLSDAKLRVLRPDLYRPLQRFRESVGLVYPQRTYLTEQLQHGDSRAAVVLSVSPLLVAAYTDEMDCVVILEFPNELAAEHRLREGSRLLTVNSYGDRDELQPDLIPGPNHTLTFRKSSRQFLGILRGARPPLRPPVGPRVEPQEPDHRTLGLGQVGHQHLRFAFRGANLVTLDRREHFD